MSRTTYYKEIECEATPSDLNDSAIVTVRDEVDNRQYLRVARGFLTEAGGKTYLPIHLIEIDADARRALVQLPYEADSGVGRIWVPADRFRRVEADHPQPAGTRA